MWRGQNKGGDGGGRMRTRGRGRWMKRGAAGLPSHLVTKGGDGLDSGIFLSRNGDVEGWAASGPVRRDGGEREGLGGRVIRTCDQRERGGLAYLM